MESGLLQSFECLDRLRDLLCCFARLGRGDDIAHHRDAIESASRLGYGAPHTMQRIRRLDPSFALQSTSHRDRNKTQKKQEYPKSSQNLINNAIKQEQRLTDRNSFDVRPHKDLQHLGDASRAHNRTRNILRLRTPHRTDTNVVRAVRHSFLHVHRSVDRDADDGVWREQGTGDGDGHVGLSEMHAVCLHTERNVDAVIDEDRDVVFATYLFGLLGYLEELRGRVELAFQVLNRVLVFRVSLLGCELVASQRVVRDVYVLHLYLPSFLGSAQG